MTIERRRHCECLTPRPICRHGGQASGPATLIPYARVRKYYFAQHKSMSMELLGTEENEGLNSYHASGGSPCSSTQLANEGLPDGVEHFHALEERQAYLRSTIAYLRSESFGIRATLATCRAFRWGCFACPRPAGHSAS